METVRRMLILWGWSWRRAHKKRRPTSDQTQAIAFVRSNLELAPAATPGDVIDCDGAAFLLYAESVCTWAGRGADGNQIHIGEDEEQSYTVMDGGDDGWMAWHCSWS
jgi:hypothetical protein